MKKIIPGSLLIALTIISFFAGCNYNDNQTDNMRAATLSSEKAADASLSDFQQFKQNADYEINDNERSLIILRVRMTHMKEEAYGKYLASLASLEKRNDSLKIEIGGFIDDGKGNWKVFRAGFNNDMDTLNRDFKKISE